MEVIIITGEDCLHCVELEASLTETRLSVPHRFLDKRDAMPLFEAHPLFAASVDVLPFAGVFDEGECLAIVRAATIERIEEALISL
jgi:hypothetical protein